MTSSCAAATARIYGSRMYTFSPCICSWWLQTATRVQPYIYMWFWCQNKKKRIYFTRAGWECTTISLNPVDITLHRFIHNTPHTSPLMTRYEVSFRNTNPDKCLCLVISWCMQYRVKLLHTICSADNVGFHILTMIKHRIRHKTGFYTRLYITLQPLYWFGFWAIEIYPMANHISRQVIFSAYEYISVF